MKIIVQIGARWAEHHVNMFKEFSIQVESEVFSHIRLTEDVYNEVKDKLEIGDEDMLIAWGTEFSKADVMSSSYGYIQSLSTKGYPQPDNDFDYLKESYDLTNYCETCGNGAIQSNPLRIKGEIKWGKSRIGTLNWIYDELLVEKEFYEDVLKGLGINSKPVLLHKTGKTSMKTVQLDLPSTNAPIIGLNSLSTTCDSCDWKKYSPRQIGFFSGYEEDQNMMIFKSHEYFGQGGLSYKRIVVSRELQDVLLKNKVLSMRNIVPAHNPRENWTQVFRLRN